VFKLLPSLNHFLKYRGEEDDRTYEGLILTSNDEEAMQSYFRFVEMPKHTKGTMSLNSISHSSNTNETGEFMPDTKIDIDLSSDKEAFKGRLKDSFKDVFEMMDISKIRAYRISFKFSDLVTSEFTCKLLEIVSLK
jgi:hypothetical protein